MQSAGAVPFRAVPPKTTRLASWPAMKDISTLPAAAAHPVAETQSPAPSSNAEAPFFLDELFFSRTDGRGVIQAFNHVFERIAEYPAAQLCGAPHKIIRHTDMPRGVFWLLWNGLKNNELVGAYVKNRSKSGRYYWVYAVISPLDDGYLSVRIKPTSPMLARVERLYADLLEDEKRSGLSPEQSARALVRKLADEGFASYGVFQSEALLQEFQTRHTALSRPRDRDVERGAAIRAACQKIEAEVASLNHHLAKTAITTANFKVQAAKIMGQCPAMRVIAENYEVMIEDLRTALADLVPAHGQTSVWDCGQEVAAVFHLCASTLMTEALDSFKTEVGDGRTDMASEIEHLRGLVSQYQDRAMRAREQALQTTQRIQRQADSLSRTIMSLSVIRNTISIEANMHKNVFGALTAIVQSINAFHDIFEDHLQKLRDAAVSMAG